MSLFFPPLTDGLQKTLDANLLTGVTASATLNNVTGIQNKLGLFVVDRVDGNNNLTPNKREYISFAGTSGSTVVTLTRGLAGSTDQDHAVGAIVEFVSDVVQQQAIIDYIEALNTTVSALPTASSTTTFTNKDLTSTTNTFGNNVYSNSLAYQCIINGGFTVNQRVYISNATLAAGVYGHDRWKAGASGGDYTFTQLAQATTITIKTGKSLIQVIEDKNVIGGTYTLSWTGTAQARFGINSATPSGAYAASPITITTQTAGTVMSVEFNEGTLGQVNLANSSVALPFMPKSYEEELRACQRYFQLGGAGATGTFESTTKVSLGFTFSNNMRIAPGVALNTTSPIVSEHGIGDRTATSSTYSQIFSTINSLGFTVDGFSGATAGKGCTMKGNYLNISAEL